VVVSEDPIVLGQERFLTMGLLDVLVASGAGSDQWRVRTTTYTYQLSDADEREVMIYKWHPDPVSRSPIANPHLHSGRGLAHPALPPPFRRRVGRLAKARLPTGHITLPTLLGTIIADLTHHDDWTARLDGAHDLLMSSFDLPA